MANDFAKLERLIAGLEHLAEDAIAEISTELAPAIQEVIDDQYTEGHGPAEGWKQLATGKPAHLQKSGDMSANSRAIKGVAGVTVRIPKPGGFHQSGTAKMPARKIVPDEGTLPGRWGEAVANTIRAVVIESIKG